MAQQIKQGNIFGRIGSNIGKGLAEQIPKEVERNRLSEGLKELGENKDLSPFQQFSQLSSIPGVTPQMIESGAKLLQQQGLRNNYAQAAGRQRGNENPIQPGNGIQDVNFANMNQRKNTGSDNNYQSELVSPNAEGQPQIVEKNPLRNEAVPALPWTQQQKIEDLADLQNKFPNATQEQLNEMSRENESRDLARPAAVREQDKYFKEKQKEAEDSFTNHLEELLQKEGSAVYGDLTGETLNNLKRSMAADLRANPKATIEDVANKWAQKGLQLGKTKSQLKEFSSRDSLDKIFKGKEAFDKLKTYSKIFEDTGNSNEFFDILKKKGEGGFSMSPQGAAFIAYPRSKSVDEYVKSTKNKSLLSGITKPKVSATQRALDIENKISPNDSLLAIAKALRNEDPFFNESEYWTQLREDIDKFNPRQRDEIASGESDVFSDWGDIWILPEFRGS